MSLHNLWGAADVRGLDSNADSESGALLYVYEEGTTTAVTTYTDKTGATANASPVVADSTGSFSGVYLASGRYKVEIRSSAGAALPGFPIDNVEVGPDASSPTSYSTKAALEAADVPTTGVDTLRIEGYTTAGDGGGGLYKRAVSEPVHDFKIQSNDGAFWEIVPEGNAVFLSQIGKTEGGDNYIAMQSLIDYCLYHNPGTSGVFDIEHSINTRAIRFGWGVESTTDFVGSGRFYGMGRVINGDTVTHTGTVIEMASSNTTEPVAFIQAMRDLDTFDITFRGKDYDAIVALDTDAATIHDKSTWTSAFTASNDRRAPVAAVVIDGYSGDAPTGGDPTYPTPVYPSWLGTITTGDYNKPFSSRIDFWRSEFQGAPDGLAIGPNADSGRSGGSSNTGVGNGDFIRCHQCKFSAVLNCITTGHDQSRSIDTYGCEARIAWRFINTAERGTQLGGIFGTQVGLNVYTHMDRLFEGAMSAAGPVAFLGGARVENLMGVASITDGNGTVRLNTLSFRDMEISLSETDARGRRNNHVEFTGETSVPVVFDNCEINGYQTFFTTNGLDVSYINGTYPRSAKQGVNDDIDAALAAVFNGTAGGLACPVEGIAPQDVRFNAASISTGNWLGEDPRRTGIGKYKLGGRDTPVPVYSEFPRYASTDSQVNTVRTPRPRFHQVEAKGAQMSISERTVTWIDAALTALSGDAQDMTALRAGKVPGNLFIDFDTNSFGYVSARSGDTLTIVLETNVRDNSGTWEVIDSISTTVGNVAFVNLRMFVPDIPVHLTTTTSSAVATAERINALTSNNSFVSVGDAVFSNNDDQFTHFSLERTKVASTSTSNEITFGGNFSKALTDERVDWWIRQ